MSKGENDEIIIKEKSIDNSSYRFRREIYCPKCHWRLMSARVYIDLGTLVIDEKWDCDHYYWDISWCDPNDFDPDYWKCKLMKPLFDELGDRIVLVVSASDGYYLLVKQKTKRK